MASGFTPERIAGLVEGAASVAGQVELAGILRSTVEFAKEITGARFAALGVVGEHGGLVDFITVGMDDEMVRSIGTPPKGVGMLGLITTTGKTIRTSDIATHPDSTTYPAGHPAMGSFLGVPIRVGEQIFGNLYLTDKPNGFTEEDEILIEFLAVTAGSAVSTLRLQDRLRRAALLEDRERIARDLHDSIIQDLFAVGLNLQAAAAQVITDPEGMRKKIDASIDHLDESIAALRRYIFDLRPPVWARPNLREALADLVGQLSAPYQATVSLEVSCSADLVPRHIADELVATVKEALSNALRHSRGDSIEVRVGCGATQAVMTVADNGVGFDPSGPGKGLGLSNMAKRVASVGGSFRVDTTSGKGTVVRATFPLAAD
ncbi:MAG: GAF domain-containing sensor histidine kinase [Actinobacteria bacterium]|nr:GAF domain-containing sensor histidine kinase [Actinomycetota bacterium]MBU1494303.1 GAF domain-containing sensor histidine kinase [Actinomycetota bacterium]MBU1866191.1 GAF domain-containing sensor histidine kinase [Actinomycetota bacterium]